MLSTQLPVASSSHWKMEESNDREDIGNIHPEEELWLLLGCILVSLFLTGTVILTACCCRLCRRRSPTRLVARRRCCCYCCCCRRRLFQSPEWLKNLSPYCRNSLCFDDPEKSEQFRSKTTKERSNNNNNNDDNCNNFNLQTKGTADPLTKSPSNMVSNKYLIASRLVKPKHEPI